MSNIIKPSTSLLPMDDIAEELKIKHGFSTKDDLSKDTKKVSGVSSELIAVAATDEFGELVDTRETIKNALNLGNIPASEYITKEQNTNLENFADKISKIYADEVKSLRDELYQMSGELVKRGLIKEHTLYSGFQDFFKESNPVFLKAPICGIKQDAMGAGVTSVSVEAPSEFAIGDYIVIHKEEDPLNNFKPTSELVRIVDKNDALEEITFVPALTDLAKDNVKIYKALGQYNKGSFSFSKSEKNTIIDKERMTMLNDDPTPGMQLKIDKDNTGYAVSFTVPKAVAGALSKFSILAKSTGTPGALMCYVIPEEKKSSFRNLAEAEEAGYVVAISETVPALMSMSYETVDFTFKDPITGGVPMLEGDKYIFIIEALSADKENSHWEISVCYHENDLKKNNITYRYTEIPSAEIDLEKVALTEDGVVHNRDLYFILTTKEVAAEHETAFREGLYSTRFKLPAPINVSRARLMLRIAREGNYIVTSSPGAYHDGNTLSMGLDPKVGTYNLSQGSGISNNDKIAIGTDIRTVSSVNNNTIAIEKGAYIDSAAELYRLGYTVLLRAYNNVLDPVTKKYVRLDEQYITMPISTIISDGNKVAPYISDRILFEGELLKDENNVPKYANEFELQIVWKSGFGAEVMTSNKDLIGKIFDLTLSFDKTL